MAWKLTWYQSAAIGDPRVCYTITSEGDAIVAKRVLFCLLDLSDAFLSYILVSQPRRSRVRYLGVNLVPEGGGADVD